jgi:hypothetical protein
MHFEVGERLERKLEKKKKKSSKIRRRMSEGLKFPTNLEVGGIYINVNLRVLLEISLLATDLATEKFRSL